MHYLVLVEEQTSIDLFNFRVHFVLILYAESVDGVAHFTLTMQDCELVLAEFVKTKKLLSLKISLKTMYNVLVLVLLTRCVVIND